MRGRARKDACNASTESVGGSSMKDGHSKPWSLIEPDQEGVDSVSAGIDATPDSLPSMAVGPKSPPALVSLVQKWKLGWTWAIPATVLAAGWAFAAFVSKPESASLHFGGIFLLTALATALLGVARML